MIKQIALTIILATAMVACGQEPQKSESTGADGVSLRVELPDADPIEASVKIEGTVLDLMQKASDENLLTFKKEGDGEKALITTIQGVAPSNDDDKGKYWIYAVNGKMANLGVGSMKVKTGDSVRWCYLTYENRKSCSESAASPEEAAE